MDELEEVSRFIQQEFNDLLDIDRLMGKYPECFNDKTAMITAAKRQATFKISVKVRDLIEQRKQKTA